MRAGLGAELVNYPDQWEKAWDPHAILGNGDCLFAAVKRGDALDKGASGGVDPGRLRQDAVAYLAQLADCVDRGEASEQELGNFDTFIVDGDINCGPGGGCPCGWRASRGGGGRTSNRRGGAPQYVMVGGESVRNQEWYKEAAAALLLPCPALSSVAS